MNQKKQVLAEVFGYPIANKSSEAKRYRSLRLCPFNNIVPNCTKDKAKDPLGVCSVLHSEAPVITCPVRFRENWIITGDAASFFFPKNSPWTSLTEVRLNDASGKSAGNIDLVLVSYDDSGAITDFGALEIQAVYISGNVRDSFEYFIKNAAESSITTWPDQANNPRPDFLSSSRKRLAPQLLFKGGILHSWKKKIAIVLNKAFFDTLPVLPSVAKEEADIAWLVYDLELFGKSNRAQYKLRKVDEVYTQFEPALQSITMPTPGDISDFVKSLQVRLDKRLATPPTNKTLDSPF